MFLIFKEKNPEKLPRFIKIYPVIMYQQAYYIPKIKAVMY